MAEKIINILKAGECCEIVNANRYGKITVNRPLKHNFKLYPLINMEPDVVWCVCCDEDDGRLVVTVEGLAFAKPRTIFVDQRLELVSRNEVILVKLLAPEQVQITVVPL